MLSVGQTLTLSVVSCGFSSLFRFVSASQIAMDLEVSPDSDQNELLRPLTVDCSLPRSSMQPSGLRMSRS